MPGPALALVPCAAGQPWSGQHRATAASPRDAALSGTGAYDIVASLTTEVGPVPPGSAGDEAAVACAQRKLAAALGDRADRPCAALIRGHSSFLLIGDIPQFLAPFA